MSLELLECLQFIDLPYEELSASLLKEVKTAEEASAALVYCVTSIGEPALTLTQRGDLVGLLNLFKPVKNNFLVSGAITSIMLVIYFSTAAKERPLKDWFVYANVESSSTVH
jgi:hypothetical protein